MFVPMFLKGRFARCLLTLGVTDDAAGCTRGRTRAARAMPAIANGSSTFNGEERANRKREAAGRTERVVEASLHHRVPAGLTTEIVATSTSFSPSGARAEGDQEQPGRRSAGAQVREIVYAPEQPDHGCRADEAGSGPDCHARPVDAAVPTSSTK